MVPPNAQAQTKKTEISASNTGRDRSDVSDAETDDTEEKTGSSVLKATPNRINGWTYSDTFSSNQFAGVACIQSSLKSLRFPAYEPYLALSSQRLAMVGYDGEPAVLGFCTPTYMASSGAALFGRVQVQVASLTGVATGASYLYLSYSSDARHWSPPQALSIGFNQVNLGPMVGAGFVVFLGSNRAIDNLTIELGPGAATRSVSSGASIQAAIDLAGTGDVIEVGPGSYNGGLDLRGKAIILRSQSGPEQTSIVCQPGQRGFYVPNDPTGAAVIQGFSIINGNVIGTASPYGGGILCENSSPFIINCHIQQCQANTGGGIACLGGAPTIANCLIQANDADTEGGGIALAQGSHATIDYATILDNTAPLGAGVYINHNHFTGTTDVATNVIRNSLLAFNGMRQMAEKGGGLYGTGPYLRMRLENCILSRNTAGRGSAYLAESVGNTFDEFWHMKLLNCTIADNTPSFACIEVTQGRTQIKNSIVWTDGASPINLPYNSYDVSFSTISGGYTGQGNLSATPQFRSVTSNPNSMPDYRLQSNSPGVDAGDYFHPVATEASPHGSRINQGAFGGSIHATDGGRTLHVDNQRGNDSYSGLSRSHPFHSIRQAMDAAQDGDAVLIWPGVYDESVSVPDLQIMIQGATDPPIIRGGYQSAFSLTQQQGPETILKNMIITDSSQAILCEFAYPTLTHLTIVQNEGGISSEPPEPDVSGCIFWMNAWDLWGCTAKYSCISKDPLFANAEIGDFHLKSVVGRYDPQTGNWTADSQHSQCIDAGNPAFSTGSEPLPQGNRINVGAYGGTPYASMGTPNGEFISDKLVHAMQPWLDRLLIHTATVDWNTIIFLNSIEKEGVSKAGRGVIIGP